MGSKSDSALADQAAAVLKEFNIPAEIHVISAHRNPVKIKKFAAGARSNNIGCIIAIAGLAAHLPGVIASLTVLPVIGVPGDGGPLKGQDALYSIVQMPSGIPVACVGIANAKNAGLLAVQILAAGNEQLFDAMVKYRLTFNDDQA